MVKTFCFLHLQVIRDGMGQASKVCNKVTLDTLITNCLIVDAIQGIVKADVGIKVQEFFVLFYFKILKELKKNGFFQMF